MQAAIVAQQVVQVQVGLPQAPGVQPADGVQGLAQHRLLGGGQQRLARHGAPGVPQALGAFQIVEQQPAALPSRETVSQQSRRSQALLGEQARAGQFALEMPLGLATDQQLGQHRAAAPTRQADIALPRQHPQQALHHQRFAIQLQRERQGRRAAGLLQFVQAHQRDSLCRRRAPRRRLQRSTAAPSPR